MYLKRGKRERFRRVDRDGIGRHRPYPPSNTRSLMSTSKIRLVNGPYDGQVVEDPPTSEVLWVYRNMYGVLRAVKAGGLPRTSTMAAYVVLPGRLEALHGAT